VRRHRIGLWGSQKMTRALLLRTVRKTVLSTYVLVDLTGHPVAKGSLIGVASIAHYRPAFDTVYFLATAPNGAIYEVARSTTWPEAVHRRILPLGSRVRVDA
jgi:hypothetical protein